MKHKCRFCAAQGLESFGRKGHGEWTKPTLPNTERVECENGHRWSVPKEKEKQSA
jgi:hypothetical protein